MTRALAEWSVTMLDTVQFDSSPLRTVAAAARYRPSAPWLLDLFCGAGGAAMGYWRAGFNVLGVDIHPQPRYPFWFVQGDALVFARQHGREFNVIHASPPCQRYTCLQHAAQNASVHPDLVEPTRRVLREIGKPYIIENVKGAPLYNYLILHGSMFGLNLFRERWFECNPVLMFSPATVRRNYSPVPVNSSCAQKMPTHAESSRAMKIAWMTNTELREAIPPAYTEYIGQQIMRAIQYTHEHDTAPQAHDSADAEQLALFEDERPARGAQ